MSSRPEKTLNRPRQKYFVHDLILFVGSPSRVTQILFMSVLSLRFIAEDKYVIHINNLTYQGKRQKIFDVSGLVAINDTNTARARHGAEDGQRERKRACM